MYFFHNYLATHDIYIVGNTLAPHDVCPISLTVADRLRKIPGCVNAEASAVGAISVEFSRSELTEAEIRKALAQMSVRPRPEIGAASATAATKAHDHAE